MKMRICAAAFAATFAFAGPAAAGAITPVYGQWADPALTWSIVERGTSLGTMDRYLDPEDDTALGSQQAVWNFDEVAAQAFDTWEGAANLTFTRVEDDGAPFGSASVSTIRLWFTRLDDPYAGFGFYPSGHPAGGDIVFNLNYRPSWYRLTLHEIGHAIGLGHSDDPFSVMYPGGWSTTLRPGDLAAVQQLYGAPVVASVDEPSPAPLLGAGLLLLVGLGVIRRRQPAT